MGIQNKMSARPQMPRRRSFAAALGAFAADESGVTAVEYALLCFIFSAIVVAVGQVGPAVFGLFDKVGNSFSH